MADIRTRFAVVIVDLYGNEQHLEHHRESYYRAKTITNTQCAELTEKGRNYVFGGTFNEVDFWEGDSSEEVEAVADTFNRLWSKKNLYQAPHKLARGYRINPQGGTFVGTFKQK